MIKRNNYNILYGLKIFKSILSTFLDTFFGIVFFSII